MKLPVEFYELLRNRINLSDIVREKVALLKKSNEYLGLCPFHNEKTPSFSVNDVKGVYYCFGCAASGDVITFFSKMNGISYSDSAVKLAQDHNIELPTITKEQKIIYEESEQVLNILQIASKFFQSKLDANSLDYLKNRKINKKTIEEFTIGFAPSGGKLQQFFKEKEIPEAMLIKAGLIGKRDDGRLYEIFHDRIMFPIKNVYNKVIGFGGRVIGEGLPKYLNSPETTIFKKNETLYGENKAIKAAYNKKYSILVEGYLDVITLHEAGFDETVASLGTAITEKHLRKLWRVAEEIVLCLDGDEAGIKASIRLINLSLPFISNNKKISFIQLPSNSDPDNIIRQGGDKMFSRLLSDRIELSEMIWQIEYDGKIFTSPEARAQLEVNLENYCKQITDNVLSSHYRKFFKDQIWQNLIKYKGKVSQTTKLMPQYNYSEIETLEHALCSMFIRFPEILNNEITKDFLASLSLKNTELSDFRDWYFELITKNNYSKIENIKETVEKTRFWDSFLLLSRPDNLFLNISSNNKGIDPNLLWELLRKQYHLVMLKQEYASIIQNASDNFNKKAILYQEEIFKISKELQNLKESFSNN